MNAHTQFNRLGAVKRFFEPWTEEEEALMRLEYKIKGVRHMMKILNRTKGSICAKAKAMGLSGKWILVEVRHGFGLEIDDKLAELGKLNGDKEGG